MKPILINATDLRIRAREILERVKFKGEHFVVHTFGQPMAVIISVEEYNQLIATESRVSETRIGLSNGQNRTDNSGLTD